MKENEIVEGNKFRRRPWAYPKSVIKKNDAFRAPFRYKKPTIGRFVLTIPMWNGKFFFIELPCDYCEHDIKIILKQLEVIEMSFEQRHKTQTPKQ